MRSMRLPLALVHAHRIAVGRQYFVGHAAHEAAFEPAPREHVDHRHLLGDAHGLAAVGDRVAEDQQPRLLGQPRQRGEHQRRRRVDAGRGLVMLVEHDLDALVLRDQPLVDVAIVERGALLRIVVAVRQRDADRLVFVRRRQIGIGILAEVPCFHRRAPDRLGRLFALQELQDRRCGRGGLLDLRQVSGLRDGLDPRLRDERGVAREIVGRDDAVARAAHEQRRHVHPVQPMLELGIVHVRLPGQQRQASRCCGQRYASSSSGIVASSAACLAGIVEAELVELRRAAWRRRRECRACRTCRS